MDTLESPDFLVKEFERQVQNLIEKDYPLISLKKEEFLKILEPLKEKVKSLKTPKLDLEKGTIPFVIVIKRDAVEAEKAMPLVNREGKQGLVKLFPLQSKDFNPIEDINLPTNLAYLLVDVDRGKESINIPPSEALAQIKKMRRSPLTIDEGVAIITHFPQFLQKNNCFSLLASRHAGDKRVPAIWINAEKRPNLGWCWDGNPHTWLGSASCAKRVA